MADIDLNVKNYTLSELITIAGLDLNYITKNDIIKNTDKLFNKFKEKNQPLAVFFLEVQSQLLQYAEGLEVDDEDDTEGKIIVESFGNRTDDAIYPAGEKQVTDWYENENLTQSDKNQVNKITQRKQKIGLFGNQHMPMNREQ